MRVVVVLIVWGLVVAAFMRLNRAFDVEVFFVLMLLGLIILVELSDTATTQPTHLRWMKCMIAAGVLIFGWIVANKIMEMLAG